MAIILGIESSCDDTSASIVKDGVVLSNIIASQKIHEQYGGVIPELASRVHQQNIIPVVDTALKKAGISKEEISAIAFTKGPGLLGSLLVGVSFAKGFAASLNVPLIEVNHLQGHVLSHFLKLPDVEIKQPEFPFLCLLVSGGHTQIIIVKDYLDFEVIGTTIDDAAGEAFDKCAKVIGLPYPGGPVIDRLAKEGNPETFKFNKPRMDDFEYSFSGLKTSFLYSIQKYVKENPNFIEENLNDICASLQRTIVDILMDKFIKAQEHTGIKDVGIAGGVSANSEMASRLRTEGELRGWNVYIPKFEFTMDNAAMIAITGYYKYLKEEFSSLDVVASARL